MSKKKHITIKDVAEHANVSQMTVSRVLNDRNSVRESTRERVQTAMRTLNYRPNLMARKLAGRKGKFVGLVYRNPSYGYLSEFLLGALNSCRELGHYLIVEEPLVDDHMTELEFIEKRFLNSGIQSLIVVPPLSENKKLIESLKATGISFVCVGPMSSKLGVLNVAMDDQKAAKEMTDYLFKIGHQKVAIIKGPDDHNASELRFRGFLKSVEAHGVSSNDLLINEGDFTYRSGMKCAAELLENHDQLDAIFACNDDMAAGAIAAAHQRGLRVPEDISVVGFDDTQIASSIWPTLTTVRQPIRQLARRAIELLVSDNLTTEDKEPQLLGYELVVRKSSAPS